MVRAPVAFFHDSLSVRPWFVGGIFMIQFFRGMFRFRPVETSRVVRTCRHAHPAPDANILINQNIALLVIKVCSDWTYPDTRRLLTVHAESREEEFLVESIFELVNVYPFLFERDKMARLASSRAGAAAGTLAQVDNHGPDFRPVVIFKEGKAAWGDWLFTSDLGNTVYN